MLKLTAVITTYNEQDMLQDCLESVRWADELFVVDSFSTDRTLEIARTYNARIIQHQYEYPAAQKNWAIPQASHEWILLLDADERVTEDLRQEIQALLQSPPKHNAYHVYRRTFFLGQELKYSGYQRDDVIRLFHRDRCHYEDVLVHEGLKTTGKLGRLQGRLKHCCWRSFDQYFEKFGRYTTWAAQDLMTQGRKPHLGNMVLRPWWRFFRMYIVQGGYRDGSAGFVSCVLCSYYVFVKYAKLWHLRRCQ